jgi:hypothetical protein
MNSKHYEAWKKSHQIETSDFDIVDSVMEQVTRRTCQKSSLRNLSEILLSNLIQTKTCIRIFVVASGALAGLIRMMFLTYYALFT